MFIENKYYKWYTAIIKKAISRDANNLGYVEKHHIIPRSLGGLDIDSNIAILTGREHFICHYLLTKCTTGVAYHKMIYACQGMRRSRNYQDRYINSRLYEVIKNEGARIQSERFIGKKLSDEHKAKISKSGKGRIRSPETIEKTRIANTGKKRNSEQIESSRTGLLKYYASKTPEERSTLQAKGAEKRSAALKGRVFTEEHRKALSESLTGKYKGVPKSKECKQSMKKPKSEEHRKAISEGRKAKFAAIRAAKLNLHS